MGNQPSSPSHQIIVDYDDIPLEANQLDFVEENPSEEEEEEEDDGNLAVRKTPMVLMPFSIQERSVTVCNMIPIQKEEGRAARNIPWKVGVPAQLDFLIDASSPCSIGIFWTPDPVKNPLDNQFSFKSSRCAHREISAGMNQFISFTPEDLPEFKKKDKSKLESTSKQPLIIQVRNKAYKSGSKDLRYITLYISFEKLEEENYVLLVDKTSATCRGEEYILHDLYGINALQLEAEGEECVICMSEARNTVLLPCRHACLCDECSELFRERTEKCPICRSRVLHLLSMDHPPLPLPLPLLPEVKVEGM